MSSSNSCSILILFSLLLLLISDATVAGSCLRKCGGIDIPYPFGIGMDCYLITSKECSSDKEEYGSLLNLTGTPFYVADTNILLVVGCDNTALLTNVKPSMVGCSSSCGTRNLTASEYYTAKINCNTKAFMADSNI